MLNENLKYCLYIHTNKLNNKKYVGITSKNPPSKRWGLNGNGYKGQVFYNAIQKYGWNNFIHETIIDNISMEKACELEIKIIKDLNTCDRKFGYNIDCGGIRESENLNNDTLVGLNNYTNNCKKKIICINDLKVYDSILEVEKIFNIPNSNIIKCCKGNRRYSGIINGDKMVWRYYDEDINYSEIQDEILKNSNEITRIYKNCKPIICLNTKDIFETIQFACEKYGLENSNLCCALKGKTNYCGKYNNEKLRWMYYYDYIKNGEKPIKQNKNLTKVICLTDNKVFDSFVDAKEYYNLPYTQSITRCCKKLQKTFGKNKEGIPLRWMYYKDYKQKEGIE